MPKYNEYSDAGALLSTDLIAISRSPFTPGTFFTTTPPELTTFVTDTLSNAYAFQNGGNIAPSNPLGNENVLITIKATAPGINFTLPSMSINDVNSSAKGTLFWILATSDSDNFNILMPDNSTVLVPNMIAGQLVIVGLMSKNTSVNGTLQIFYNSASLTNIVKCFATVITNAPLDATYDNGTNGVGATFTSNTNVGFSVSGSTPGLDDYVIINGESDFSQNGIFQVTTLGEVDSNPYVLTRPSFYDGSVYGKITTGNIVLVELQNGLSQQNANFYWQQYNVSAVGTDPIFFNAVTQTDNSTVFYNEDGQLYSTGSIGKNSICMPATAFYPALTNGATLAQFESSTNKNNYRGWSFVASGNNNIIIRYPMPKSWNQGTVSFILYWKTSGTSGNVVWSISGIIRQNGAAEDVAFGTPVTLTSAANGTAQYEIITSETSAMTCAGTAGNPSEIEILINRDGGSGSDTLAAAAILTSVIMNITTNAVNDA